MTLWQPGMRMTAARLNPGDWTPIPLSGTWVWGGGANDGVPSLRITTDGLLEVSGLVKGTALAINASIALGTLPTSISSQMSLWVRGVMPSSNAGSYGMLAINPSGAITLYNGATAATTSTWFQLDGVRGRIA